MFLIKILSLTFSEFAPMFQKHSNFILIKRFLNSVTYLLNLELRRYHYIFEQIRNVAPIASNIMRWHQLWSLSSVKKNYHPNPLLSFVERK